MIVRIASAGELLGYTALLSGEPYTAAAETMEESCLCFLPKQFVMSSLQSDPAMGLHLIRMLSREVRQQEDRLVSVAQKRVRERLAETLLVLRQSHGIDDRKGVLITLRLKREDLASIIGTSTESLVRELQELRRQEIIQVTHRTIRILDLPKLILTANL
jgi:CRP/FNR family transcriptional regulator